MRISTLFRRPESRRGMLHAAVIGGLITLLAASGAGISFAVWNAQATVSGTATAASVSMSTENFSSNDFTFRNNALSVRSSVTIRNTTDTTSATKADVRVALDSASNTEGLADDIRVRVWRLTGANCDAAPTLPVREGTWASFTTFTEPALVQAGSAVTYCIISSAVGDERSILAVADGSAMIQPRITATLNVHSLTATAVATAQQQTSHIYPATSQPSGAAWFQIRNTASGRGCVDVNGGTYPAGTNLIDYACKTGNDSSTQNQDWQVRATSTDPSYVALVARYNTDLRITATNSNARVEVQTGASAAAEWQLQQRNTSGGAAVFQIVNRASGLCLQSPTAGAALIVAQCDGSAQQGYTFDLRAQITPSIPSLACANTPGTTNQSVVLSWTQPALAEYTIAAQKSGSTWVTLGTVPVGATSYALPGADGTWSDGTRNVRLTFGSFTVSTSIWKGVTASEQRIRCSAPTANVAGLVCSNLPNGVALAWSEPALGSYQFEVRRTASSSNWDLVATTTAGQMSTTITGAVNSSITGGERELRVRSGSSTLAGSPIMVWKGQLTVGGAQVLQCAMPTPNFAGLTCTNVGNNDVSIGWSHPAYSAYVLSLLEGAGGEGAVSFTSAEIGAPSVTISAGSNWAAGTRSIRVQSGATSATIDVVKSGTANGWFQTHRLRCIETNKGRPNTPAEAAPAPETTPAPELTPTKTAELSGTDGYYLGLLWDAQTVGATTTYSVLLDGQPLTVTPVNEYANDRLHLYPADFAAAGVGERVLQVFDSTTLVISQALRITENPNEASNRLVFRR